MSGNSEEKKTFYRLVPCPAYDVEGIESWLEDLAEEGLFLTSDGFFFGFGFFHKEEPKKLKYRLQAKSDHGSFFADGCEPLQEEMELSKEFGWEFVVSHGDFFIYRSFEEQVRELNSDTAVQAITMKQVQKRQINSIFGCLLWLIIYPLAKQKGAFLLPMLYMKSWFYLFTLTMILWFFLGSVWKLVYYTKLRRKLKKGEQPDREKNWKKKAWQHPVKTIVQIILCCIWGCMVLTNIHRQVLFEDEIPLQEYIGTPPFATMADLAPGKPYNIENMGYFNTVTEWSDVLAPVNFIWEEYASVQATEERKVSGMWDVNYHETKWEWMAKQIAKEYLRKDQKEDFEWLGELDLGIDYAVAYIDDIHRTKVILRHGTTVLQGTFLEYSGEKEDYFSLEEWAKIMADSIR